MATSMITKVIRLLTEIWNARKPAKTRKPMAISGMKRNNAVCPFKTDASATTNESRPIMVQAGKIHISKVLTANGIPPLFNPINVSVCVEDAPGSIWQKEINSISSSLVTSFLLSTKVFSIIPKWPCGPPKAVTLWSSTAFRKGICRMNANNAGK